MLNGTGEGNRTLVIIPLVKSDLRCSNPFACGSGLTALLLMSVRDQDPVVETVGMVL
jgi:hypothetical protein